MRILRIDSWDGRPGGAQDYVREIGVELARRGHVTKVVNLVSEPPPASGSDNAYVPVPSAWGRRLPHDVIAAPLVESTIRDALREFRPDLVHLHHFDAAFASIARIVPELTVPLVMTSHDAELVCPISTLVRPGNIVCEGGIEVRCLFTGCHVGFGGLYNLWQRRVFDAEVAPKVRAYLGPSYSVTNYLDAHGYRPAIHLPSFARIPPEVTAAPTPAPPDSVPPTLGYLGRLEWYKGVHDLIDALAILRREVPTVRLTIAGDGPFRGALDAQVERLGLRAAVSFVGSVGGSSKEEWFRGIHVLATPSNFWENFPLVALEGLVRGRPVVGTQIGGIPDIVEPEVTGLLVPIADPVGLAAALGRLIGDPGLRSRLGGEGRRRVLARFTPELHADRLEAVYRAILDGRNLASRSEAEALRSGGSG
ncbi:MAG: glycosyltransferase family 4 protein [Thermoplasmata archaeon]|nr:glycosyltransferase family 4 protein [Thermoplasmata archaeon]